MPVQFFFGKTNGLALRHGLERQARRLVGNIAPDGKHQFARRGKPGSSFLSVLEVVSPPDAFGDDIHVAVDLILVDDNFIFGKRPPSLIVRQPMDFLFAQSLSVSKYFCPFFHTGNYDYA